MTQKKLAALAGVSPATISKAFNFSSDISDETRELIFNLAREHGCFDKFSKGKYHKKIVAVLSPEIKSDFYNSIVASLDKRLASIGAIMSLAITDFDARKEKEYFEYYSKDNRSDAIIILSPSASIKNPDSFPAVSMFSVYEQPFDSLNVDLTDAVNDAVLLLKNKGRKNIAFIGERLTSQKLATFKLAMEKNNLTLFEKFLYISDLRFENAGRWAAEEIIKSNKRPDAIICAYDYIAFGAISVLKQNGYSIPEDISVIGMDDVNLNSYVDIPLTTIQIHFDELCDMAIDLVFEKMKNKYYFLKQDVTINASLICRNSA